jgi:hypothetical protein
MSTSKEVLTVLEKEGRKIEIYDSFDPARLEDETREQYSLRRKINEMRPRGTREVVHISSFLIPKMSEDGRVELDAQGKPVFIGKSHGVTYHRPHPKGKEKEHRALMGKFEKIAKEKRNEEG